MKDIETSNHVETTQKGLEWINKSTRHNYTRIGRLGCQDRVAELDAKK